MSRQPEGLPKIFPPPVCISGSRTEFAPDLMVDTHQELLGGFAGAPKGNDLGKGTFRYVFGGLEAMYHIRITCCVTHAAFSNSLQPLLVVFENHPAQKVRRVQTRAFVWNVPETKLQEAQQRSTSFIKVWSHILLVWHILADHLGRRPGQQPSADDMFDLCSKAFKHNRHISPKLRSTPLL